ncbi:MAG: SelT/SelW/SelH family protein [Gordonia sp. (in: high G+C Gram-positive bacteria)]|uniref:SelT/SelW/SelH family protein n=1 Tax=Gordonia sp. (in: high G+C Gram-positive bacteria) TaxID=84139 RepID=UPI0039E66C46
MAAPRVTITYCAQCNWLLRASWMASELLSTFGAELGAVTLVPGEGGVFTVDVDGRRVWDRAVDEGFPDAATLKRRVRDAALPDWHLGHGDSAG